MPRHRQARDENADDEFTEEPRYERLLQRTSVELDWIYERHPDLKRRIDTYQAAKAAAGKVATRREKENVSTQTAGAPGPRRRRRLARRVGRS